MADKKLIRIGLEELATSDMEVEGSVYRKDGKKYRWVKNIGSTSLTRDGCCLNVITSVEDNQHKGVITPDAGAATGVAHVPAGSPMTGIGPSGSDTGAWGWVQVAGHRNVSMMQSSTETGQAIGGMAIATAAQLATHPWARPHAPTLAIDAGPATAFANTAYMYAKRVTLIKAMAATGPATAASAMVDIQCA
jgi:hypothetical protein